ncbi:MAG: DUF2807 domain-containing protein [Cyclobacteriaceae bacterium]
MTRISLMITACLITGIVFAQGSERRNHNGFTGVSVGGGIDLILSQSNDFSVEVETNGDLEDIETTVSQGVLKIRQKSNSWLDFDNETRVYVSLPELEYISSSGGTDVSNKGTLRGEYLEIKSSGGSDLELELVYETVRINCSGGSDVELTGESAELDLSTSGGSDFDGFDFEVADATINTSGGSDANVLVKNRISARASGASDITYRGNPKYVDVNSSGGSDINGQ